MSTESLKTILLLYLFGATLTYFHALWNAIRPPNADGDLKRRWFFASYDVWIGLYTHHGTPEKDYWDKKVYWFPLPCVGMVWERQRREK